MISIHGSSTISVHIMLAASENMSNFCAVFSVPAGTSIVGNMDGSNDVRNPNAIRNPKPTYASVVAADAPAGSNANRRREMEKQDRMKNVSFLLFNPVR